MPTPLGKDGCRQTSKESRGGKTSRTQEKATAEIGGLCEEGYEKIGDEDKREEEKTMERKNRKSGSTTVLY